MRAISVFSFDAGTSSFWWRARMELRIRVTKSATGSVKLILSPPLPVRYLCGRTSGNVHLYIVAAPHPPDLGIPRAPFIASLPALPAGLYDAGNFAPQRELTEAQ